MTTPDAAAILAELQSNDPARVRKALRARLSRAGTLDLAGLGLTDLPAEVAELTEPRDHVRRVNLADNALRTVPAVLAALPALEVLDLRKNPLAELPATLADLPALTELNVSSNKLKDLPEALFATPRLSVVAGIPKFGRAPARTTLEQFLSKTHGVDPTLRRTLFDVFRGEPADNVPLSILLQSLRGNFPELYEVAHKLILARGVKKKLGKGARVVVLGSVTFKKNDLKAALDALGAEYATKVDATTTHLVLGKSPKDLDDLDARPFAFVSEAEAQKLAAGAHEGFLAADEDDNAAHGDNLTNLFLSADPASVEMALDLVKTGGIPTTALTGLFVIARLGSDAKQRALARKLLKQYAPPAVNKVLADRGKLAYEGDKAERKTAENLAAYARACKEIDWVAVARYIRRTTGFGLSFVMTTNVPTAVKLEVLREHIRSGALNYAGLYTPRYRPDYDNPHSYYSPTPFPTFLFELTELTALDLSWCCFNTLPAAVARLDKLETLDLTGNMLTTLPDDLVQLRSLRTLRLAANAFTEFPPVLLEMPWITNLDISGNRKSSDSHLSAPIEVSAVHRIAMPDTTFEDGLSSRQTRFAEYYR